MSMNGSETIWIDADRVEEILLAIAREESVDEVEYESKLAFIQRFRAVLAEAVSQVPEVH